MTSWPACRSCGQPSRRPPDEFRANEFRAMSMDRLFDTAARARSKAQPDRITIRRPDDWHVHLRDGAMLRSVLPFTAAQFARGIIMPNLVPPVTTVAAARAYG